MGSTSAAEETETAARCQAAVVMAKAVTMMLEMALVAAERVAWVRSVWAEWMARAFAVAPAQREVRPRTE